MTLRIKEEKQKKFQHTIVDGDGYGESVGVGLNGDDDDVAAIFILLVGENSDTAVR